MKRLFKMTIRKRNTLTGYMFLLPWLAGLFVLTLYPIYYSIRLSLSGNVSIGFREVLMEWYGFGHYHYLFFTHVDFREFLVNDMQFMAVSLLIVLPFSLIVAILLNAKFRFRAVFRVVFFLPVIIMSGPAISNIMSDFQEMSIWHDMLFWAFIIMPDMMESAASFVLMNLVTFMWFSGVQVLIFLAGLQKIDRSVYEAAEIDGASKWECFWKITLPFMKVLILICAIYTIIEIASFGGTVSFLENTWNVDITQHIGQVNFFILQNVANVSRPVALSAAASWVYFLSIAVIVIGVLAVYKFFVGREDK